MSAQLEQIKKLREMGASPIMQDDVAKFLGSYNHPLFIPTIEFILKLRDAIALQGMEVAGIPKTYEPKYFENISIGGALEGTKRNPHISKDIRTQMVSYLTEIEGQLKRFDVVEEVVDQLDRNLYETKPNKKRDRIVQKTAKRGQLRSFLHSIVDALVKSNVKAVDASQKRGIIDRVKDFIAPKPQPKQEDNPPPQKTWRNKVFKPNKNNVYTSQEVKHQPIRQEAQVIADSKQPKKRDVKQEPKPKQTTKEIIASNQIDKLVKDKKQLVVDEAMKVKLDGVKAEEQPQEKPKEQQKQQVIKKQVVTEQMRDQIEARKASEQRVANMKVEEAVKMLQNSGVKTTETSSVKMDKQIKDLQAQGKTTDIQRK